jgi:hypothetical protein
VTLAFLYVPNLPLVALQLQQQGMKAVQAVLVKLHVMWVCRLMLGVVVPVHPVVMVMPEQQIVRAASRVLEY